MADNVVTSAAIGTGITLATDEIASAHHQRVKISVGADGSASDMVGGAGAVSAAVPRVTLASDDPAVTALQTLDNAISGNEMQVDVVAALPAGTNLLGRVKPEGDEYETVAASQTAQTLGATGGAGDYIAGVLVIPATTSPGNVILLDNATSITIFTGGASSVSNLVPFLIPLGMTSVSGAWKITTGANVSCIGIGNFT